MSGSPCCAFGGHGAKSERSCVSKHLVHQWSTAVPIQVGRYCDSSFTLLAGQLWLSIFDCTSVFDDARDTFWWIYKCFLFLQSFSRREHVLAVIFNSSSLIWGFSIYFILWHSVPSLLDQISFIYGDLKKINIIKYIKNAFPYWLVSIIGIIILFYIFKDEKHFYSLFFAFIAAVTFPHAIVMMSMFTKKSNKKAQL